MMLRLLEVSHPPKKIEDIQELLKDITIIDMRQEKITDKEFFTRILLPADESDDALDILQKQFSKSEHFHILIIPVEASIPRPEIEEVKEKKRKEKVSERISIEELYQDMIGGAKASKIYYALIILASIVASIGLIYDNVAVVIGSMVIAPLITSSMALSLATTLADGQLARRAVFTSFSGYFTAFIIGIMFGIIFTVDVTVPEILSRINLNLMYILVALSAGIAGSLSITKGVAQPLVGVMVSVALLPPIVTSGLLFGSQYWTEAIGAFLLSSVNVVSINLAGVVTFVVQGVNPKTWWEKKKAKKTVWTAVTIWVSLLFILIALILSYQSI